jgi:hypothetical protein
MSVGNSAVTGGVRGGASAGRGPPPRGNTAGRLLVSIAICHLLSKEDLNIGDTVRIVEAFSRY